MHAFHIAPEPSTCYHRGPYAFRRIALARGEILFFDHNPWLTMYPAPPLSRDRLCAEKVAYDQGVVFVHGRALFAT